MDDSRRPTMRSRKLGTMLRELRESRDLNLQKAARLLNRTPSSLRKLETGKRRIRRPALEHMLDRYELTDPDQRQALYDLARHAVDRGWWHRYEGKPVLPNVTLQVLPFSAGAHPGHNGSFTTLTTNGLSVVLVENLTSGWYRGRSASRWLR